MKSNKTVHPGKILDEAFLPVLNISCKKLAEDIHVPESLIDALVQGGGAVSADLALRLGRYFGNGPEYWLKLQLDFSREAICRELESIPQHSVSVPDLFTAGDRKTQQEIAGRKEIRRKWLEAHKNEYWIKEALQCLQSADLSHPTDAVAKAAVTVGDMESIRKLADAGFKRWCKEDIGWEAFRTPCLDTVEFVIENGYDVNQSMDYGDRGKATPLCEAADCGYAGVVRYLLSAGADARFRNTRGYTPLHFAASSASLETVKLLVEAGADVNGLTVPNRMRDYDPDAMSVLFLMARNGFCDGMKYLVAHGAELHHKNEAQTLLHAVCESRMHSDKIRETAEYLLDAGFDPFQFDRYKKSSVYYAAYENNTDALQALINRNVPLDRSPVLPGNDQLLPLEIAAENPDSEEDRMIAALELISEHSLPFAETHVLNCAVRSERSPRARVCRYLLDHGCPVNSAWIRKDLCGDNYFSPLHCIVSSWNDKRAGIAAMLIEAGADVNQKDPYGRTPLIRTVTRAYEYNESIEIITLLHEAGADFKVKSGNGHTILQIAKHNNAHKAAIELLKKFGAE